MQQSVALKHTIDAHPYAVGREGFVVNGSARKARMNPPVCYRDRPIFRIDVEYTRDRGLTETEIEHRLACYTQIQKK